MRGYVMRKVAKGVLLFIAGIGLLTFPLQDIDLAGAADPDYPTKPITLIIAFGAGGTTDLTARAFGEAAGKILGQPFVYVNKAGAGGTLTAMAVASAKPDGYTMGTCTPSNVLVAPFSDASPYRDLSRFTFVANYANYIYPLLVKSDAPWKNWKEFIEWAKKNPRAAKIAITGARSVASQGLVLWQLEQKEQVEFTYIPMTSSADILNATLGGHVTMYGSTADAVNNVYIKEGKLRILSYLSNEKLPGYENIPSLQDMYGFGIPNLLGIFTPKGLPDNVLKKLEDAFAKAVKDPDFVSTMKRLYTPVVYMNMAQMNKYINDMYKPTGEIMKVLKAEEAKARK
ncbi:MAG: hypothetical protein A2X92_04390 [Syntrophus sp. GWC2_56_31]|nr:MAG: hypothetical protein A2X92_04390 [Syntrophus sp. GWC2_56_31]